MSRYQGTWGHYPWWERDGRYLIHPEQRNFVSRRHFDARLFYCEGETDDGYLVLKHGVEYIRVKPDLFHRVSPPKFNLGDWVHDKEDHARVGTIRCIQLNYQYNQEYYNLLIDGRESKKRYYADDLEPVNGDDRKSSS